MKSYLRDDAQRSEIACHLLHYMKYLPAARAREALDAMMAVFRRKSSLLALIEKFPSENFLTWDQARELKKRGVEIGAHAHWHWPMNEAQSPDYLREQAQASRARIEAEIGPCRAFAYPFGNTRGCFRAAWRAVRDAGFAYGFTTLSGSLGTRSKSVPAAALRIGAAGCRSRLADPAAFGRKRAADALAGAAGRLTRPLSHSKTELSRSAPTSLTRARQMRCFVWL